MTVEKPKRRWFRLAFSLRTLLALVAIASVLICFAPDLSLACRRLALRQQIEQTGAVVIPFSEWQNFFQANVTRPAELSWIRKWLGDEPVAEIVFPVCTTQSEVDRVMHVPAGQDRSSPPSDSGLCASDPRAAMTNLMVPQMIALIACAMTLLAISACHNPQSQIDPKHDPMIALSDDTEATRRDLLKCIPVGSKISDAKKILEEDGFVCSYDKANNDQDCLYCVIQKTWRGPVVGKWQVQLLYDHAVVTDAIVSHGLVGP
jgi:hypothetical protein